MDKLKFQAGGPALLKAEFHIPISPTPNFLCMVHYLAASIDLFSGLDRSEYRIVVTVGAEEREDLDARCPWSSDYPLEWRWVEEDLFRRFSYAATGNQRLLHRFESQAVVLLDADVIVTGSLRDLVDQASGSAAVHGVPAYSSPFCRQLGIRSHREWWQRIFKRAGLGEPVFDMEHSGWGVIRTGPQDGELRFSPVYLNYGFLVAAPAIVAKLGERIFDDIADVGVAHSPFQAQIAVAMAIRRNRIPWRPLPIEFNFPNASDFFEAHGGCARAIRIFHYGQPFEIDKVRDFASYGHIETMLDREGLAPVNQALAAKLRELHYGKVVHDLKRAGVPIERPPVDYFVLERKRDRAREMVDRGELAGAHDILLEIADQLPRDAHVQYLLGFVMHSLGKDSLEAERRYMMALEHGFHEFWVRYNLGALQLQAGKREPGLSNLLRARELDPSHSGVKALLADAGC